MTTESQNLKDSITQSVTGNQLPDDTADQD